MGVIARQTIKASFVIYVGALIGAANRLYFYPKLVSKEELGILQLVIILGTLLSQFSFLGMSTSLSKYFKMFKDAGYLGQLLFLFFVVPILGFIFFATIYWCFNKDISSLYSKGDATLDEYAFYVIPIGFFILQLNSLVIFCNNQLRLTVPSIFNDLTIKLTFLTGLICIGLGWINFKEYMLYVTIGYGISFLALLVYSFILFKPPIKSKINLVPKNFVKELIQYSSWFFISSLASTFILSADSIMLGAYEGVEAVGVYTIAFFIGSVIEIPKKMIVSITTPVIAGHWNDNNTTEINKLYQQSSINQGIIGILLIVLLFTGLDELFYLMPKGNEYIVGKWVAIYIGLAKVIDMFAGVNSEIIKTSRIYRLDFILSIAFVLLVITSNYIFISIFNLGLNGAAIASLVAVFIYNLSRFVILKKVFGFNPFTSKSTMLLILGVICLAVGYLLPDFHISNSFRLNLIFSLIYKSSIISLLFILGLYQFNISPEFSKMVKKIRNRLF